MPSSEKHATVRRTLLYALSGLLLLILLALILAPGIARRYLVNHSTELVGRSLAIDKLKLNYFTGKARITGFTLFEADRQKAFASFDTLVVDLRPFKLLQRELNIQQFYLSGLSGNVIQKDSLFNFSDLIHGKSRPDAMPDTTSEDAEKDPFRFHFYDIELRSAHMEYDNKNIGDTLILQNISFFIPYVGWDQEERSEAGLRLSLENEGTLEAGININPVEGDFDMSFNLTGINLEGFRKLVSSYTRIRSIHGLFNTSLTITGNLNAPEKSIVAGRMDLTDLALTDELNRKFLGMDSLRIRIREANMHDKRFLADSVLLAEPYIFFELKDSTNNMAETLGLSPADSVSGEDLNDPASGPEDTLLPLYYDISSFRMNSGTIDFTDLTTGEAFQYQLSDVTMESEQISSISDQVPVFASMVLNNRGNLVAKATIDPADPGNLVLDYTIEDFHLPHLNIYSRYFVGFPVHYGEMFYRGHTEIRDQQLISDNHLILDNVELGEKQGGLKDIPLKFALYLLKDRNDVIDLDIPVRGRTDDPQVSVGQIVWNTLKNLVVRTASQPFESLANLLGVDPGDIETVGFQYGDTVLSDYNREQLDLLLELEQLKPGLEIEMIYYNDREREKETVLEVASADSISGEPGPAAAEAVAADSVMTVYEEIRFRKIEDYLGSVQDSTHIYLSRSNPGDPLNVGSRPRFLVHYSLKDSELVK